MKFYCVKFKEDNAVRRVWCVTESDAAEIAEGKEGVSIKEVKVPINRLDFCSWLNELEEEKE